ncbi:hypothetical protein EVAR_45453_1 [Eumeta japonica]|uniref:Uncharacterized protein n=1 Tax=Eumeta variegata TaxID=151549 RepID=A0A4C1YJ03_EUMVA|nr:hypothetical protein EVAR_45453_1 [Eumeta japonica]
MCVLFSVCATFRNVFYIRLKASKLKSPTPARCGPGAADDFRDWRLKNIGRRTDDARRNHQYRLNDETEEHCEQRLEANRLRIAQSRLDITPGQQQQSSSPRSVRTYTKRKLERRLNRQPKRIVQYERLAFRNHHCLNGKVKLPELLPPPEPLESLLSGQGTQSKHFKKNIQKYNNYFQTTSFGANIIGEQGFNPTFKATLRMMPKFRHNEPAGNAQSVDPATGSLATKLFITDSMKREGAFAIRPSDKGQNRPNYCQGFRKLYTYLLSRSCRLSNNALYVSMGWLEVGGAAGGVVAENKAHRSVDVDGGRGPPPPRR